MDILKYALCVAAGIGIGVLGTKTYFDTKYAKRADEEIDAAIDDMQNRLQKYIDEPCEEEPVEEVVRNDHGEYLASVLYSEKSEQPPVNYNKMSDEVIDISDKLKTIKETAHPEDDEPCEAYAIDSDDYISDGGYSKQALTWYEVDEVLADIADDIVDVNSTIGEDNLKDFIWSGMEEMYFRNPKTSIDYEVSRSEESYKEIIGGDYI